LDNKDAGVLNSTRVEVSVPENVTLPRKPTSETERQPQGFGRTGTAVLPENQQIITQVATGTPNTSGRATELPEVHKNFSKGEKSTDFDIMYEAERILKQRNKKNGTREFLVRWVSKNATDSCAKEQDISDKLLLHWWSTHTRKGALRKNLDISLVGTSRPWAYKRGWNLESTESCEEVDQYRNEL